MLRPVFPTLALLCLSLTVHSIEITSSTAQQCGDIQISWTGSPAEQLKFPFFINILPFLSNAIVLPISIHIWNGSTTSGSLKLPFRLPSGTQFLFAVTDRDGVGAAPVSEIKTTAYSQDSSCLDTNASPPDHFTVQKTPDPSLCPSLKISWDDTVQEDRPKILVFSPGMFPVDLDTSVAAAPLDRVVTSTGNFTSKSQVVVLFGDKRSPAQTSDLLTVGGTDGVSCSGAPSATITDHIVMSTPNVNTGQTMLSSAAARATNKAGVIIGIIVGTIVVCSALIFGVIVYRKRRDRTASGLILHTQFKRTPFMKRSFEALPSIPMPPSQPPPVPPKSPWAMYTGPTQRNANIPSSPFSPYGPPPTPLPKSPATKASRRRSYVTRTSSDASSFQYLNEGESISQSDCDTRPDSATLPDPTFLRQFAEPTPPGTPLSGRLVAYAAQSDGQYTGGPPPRWSKKTL